jgi:hypothetical protein
VVHEGQSKTNVTVVVSSAIILLPEQEMARREKTASGVLQNEAQYTV